MQDKINQFEVIIEKAIASMVFPGCSILLLNADITFSKGYGHFTYETDANHVDTTTIYDCASLTKTIAPMAIAMILIDQGVLDLDEKISKYLPEFVNQTEKEVALLSHVMTYTMDYNIPGGSKSLLGTLTPKQVAHNALSYPLKALPGTNYMYSNITAFILTQIIERVTGKNFYTLVQDYIFTPLGMSSATFFPSPEIISLIPPTEMTEDRGEVRGFVHDEFTFHTTKEGISNGAAGLFASINDIAQFLSMTLQRGTLNNKQIFSNSIVSKWTQDYYPELLPVHTPIGWGDLNNILIDKYQRNIVVKSGFTGCFMTADLKNQKGFAILSNRIYPKRPADASAFAKVKEDLMAVAFL
jgi:CubicO group peptidase (beta-lactamase class C family)